MNMRVATLLSALAMLALPAIAMAGGDGGGHGHGGQLTLDGVMHGEHAMELVAAVINFMLLIFIVRRMAAKPLGDHLSAQRREVEEGMKEAAELKAKAEAAYKEYSERLETLDDEVARLRTDIEEAAEREKKRIEEEAKAGAERIKADTAAMVERHSAELGDSIRREVVDAAVTAAEQALRSALTAEDQRKLADDFKAQLEGDGGAA